MDDKSGQEIRSYRSNQTTEPGVRRRPQTDPKLNGQDTDLDGFLGRKRGVVKLFYEREGYGFLYDMDKNEHFVHYSTIKAPGFANLAKGQHVKFDAYEGKKGLYARNVTLVVEEE